MSTRTARRRTPQFLLWVAAGFAAVAIASCLALTVWTWFQEDEMKSLRASLQVQQQEHSTAETLLVTSQSTATALEQRLESQRLRLEQDQGRRDELVAEEMQRVLERRFGGRQFRGWHGERPEP